MARRVYDRRGAEFVIAIVGPLTSFAIAGVLALARAVVGPAPAARALLGYLIFVNLLVGVFNLVPGFPLDGGRLLRAVLWKARGNLATSPPAWLAIRVADWKARPGDGAGIRRPVVMRRPRTL